MINKHTHKMSENLTQNVNCFARVCVKVSVLVTTIEWNCNGHANIHTCIHVPMNRHTYFVSYFSHKNRKKRPSVRWVGRSVGQWPSMIRKKVRLFLSFVCSCYSCCFVFILNKFFVSLSAGFLTIEFNLFLK